MPEPKEQSIQFRSNQGEYHDAVLHSTLYEQSEALKRALKMAGLFLAAAAVTVFIPLAHFVLVPSFLIAAIVVPIGIYKIRQASEYAEGTCPSCSEIIKIKLDAKDRLPLWRYCPQCDNSVQLVGKDDAG